MFLASSCSLPSLIPFVLLLLLLQTRTQDRALAGLELVTQYIDQADLQLRSVCLCLLNAGWIKGMHHQNWFLSFKPTCFRPQHIVCQAMGSTLCLGCFWRTPQWLC